MSLTVSAENAADQGYAADPGLAPLGPIGAATTPASGIAERVLGGTAILTVGVLVERGAGFVANILAARFAGASTFGAYALAISTANQISTYAAGGIGATATRFSGKYSYGSPRYGQLARALTVVSLVSAGLAAGALWLGAGPIAHLLKQAALTRLLRWASLSAAGMIVLECARGFFVGQRRLMALLLMSVVVGVSMVTLLPMAARHHDPVRMIVLQGTITTGAVLVCVLLARPLGLFSGVRPEGSLLAMLREVWSFGLVQLAGLLGANLAGWWLTTLVARTDTTLVQMGFFAIASQLRNLVGMAPGLLTEGSYAVMADPGGEAERTPHRVMALCSFASVGMALVLSSAGMIAVPWALGALYGKTYSGAGLTVAVALGIAVVHMGNAPAAARLTIVSIRSTGVINTVWAVFVACGAMLLFHFGGGAAAAMTIYFAAHVLSSTLVLWVLARKDGLPPGLLALYGFSTAASAILVTLAWTRTAYGGSSATLTGLMLVAAVLAVWALFGLGRRYGWLPTPEAMAALRARLAVLVAGRLGRRSAHV